MRPCSASAGNRLLDPPRGIGRELEAHGVVELLDRSNQTEVPFLDEVEERNVGSGVVARDGHHEPQVRLDQFPLCRLVSLVLEAGELTFLRRGQQTPVADLADVELQGVVGGRTREIRPLPRCRLVGGDLRFLLRTIEEMLSSVPFHGRCIDREVAPLEG